MYCEQCGAKILPGSRFCEECGAPVEYVDEKSTASVEIDIHVFDDSRWAEKWRAFSDSKRGSLSGIIITDTSACKDPGPFMETLYDYIYWSINKRGVYYQLLDLKTQNIVPSIDNEYDIVNVLKSISSVFRPDFHLIIGDGLVIPSFDFDNYCNDGDESVPSDLPFCTLRTKNLFEGMENFSLRDFIPTGRIPASPEKGFTMASDYFANVMDSYDKQFRGPVLGVSALVWSDESNAIYSRLANGMVLESPPVSKEKSIKDLAKTNAPGILYFNLHGSDQTKYWYGQEGNTYPEAVSPASFNGLESGYVVGVEACYGAAYDGRGESDSIVRTVMANGCSAMLGSSMIAYGTPSEPGSCADIIVGKFLQGIKQGKSVGDSYIAGVKALLDGDMEDSEVKTLQEFALYGDPSLGASGAKAFGAQEKFLSVPIPDIRQATSTALSDVNDKIAKLATKQIMKYVNETYKLFRHVEPEVISGKGKYQSVFKKNQDGFKHVLKIYYDAEGTVLKELLSK